MKKAIQVLKYLDPGIPWQRILFQTTLYRILFKFRFKRTAIDRIEGLHHYREICKRADYRTDKIHERSRHGRHANIGIEVHQTIIDHVGGSAHFLDPGMALEEITQGSLFGLSQPGRNIGGGFEASDEGQILQQRTLQGGQLFWRERKKTTSGSV